MSFLLLLLRPFSMYLPTAVTISSSLMTFSCDIQLNSLISRKAVMGNFIDKKEMRMNENPRAYMTLLPPCSIFFLTPSRCSSGLGSFVLIFFSATTLSVPRTLARKTYLSVRPCHTHMRGQPTEQGTEERRWISDACCVTYP